MKTPNTKTAKREPAKHRRKTIVLPEDAMLAVEMLAQRKRRTFQQLAEEAISDLLKKHRQATSFKDALKQSLRSEPANDRGERRRGK